MTKGFVLAAGFGERLRPITNFVPKPLLPVGNVPLIGYSLKWLSHHGITDVIVNVHHLGKSIKGALGDGSKYGVAITYSEEKEILGTGGALKKMHHLLEDETCVVVNSDTIFDLDLNRVLEAHKNKNALATMVLRSDANQDQYGGQLEIDDQGIVRKILGHGKFKGKLHAFMHAGVHVLEPGFLEYVPPDIETCVIRYAAVKALGNDKTILGVVTDGFWCETGVPERYLHANEQALDKNMVLPHADPLSGYALQPKKAISDVVCMGTEVELAAGVDIRPPVLLGDGVRIGEHAVVGPYCVVGANASIGKESKIAHTVVLNGARVESGTQLTQAIVCKKAILDLTQRDAKQGVSEAEDTA